MNNQPTTEVSAILADEIITINARQKASEIDAESLQRELIAQLYIQNHYLTKSTENLTSIKKNVVFFSVVLVISLVIGFSAAMTSN